MILCCGEALIDMLPRKTQDGAGAFEPFAGGAVFNTAIALGRLGAETGFFSGLSSDFFGQILRDSLAESGVDTSPCHIADRPTTLAFVRLVDGQASYAFYDEQTAGRMLSQADLPVTDAKALFFGGISLVVDPCGDTYRALLEREADRATIMIDPNIRPGFITDEPAYRARIDAMMGKADIIKLSDEDLEWLMGPGAIEDHVATLLAAGAQLVCITRGAEGVTGYTADHRIDVPTQKVTVVDTVGAGDTFNAGLLASLDAQGWLEKDKLSALPAEVLRQALDHGARAAAVTVSRAGANPPWAREF